MSDEQPLDPLAGTPLPSQHAEVGVETRRLQQAIATSLFGDAAPADPVQIGRFAITERLGSGGMGVVYLAHDPRLERPVALKVMRKDLQHAARDRMVREGRSLARLDHPNVVPVYDVGFVDGRVFVAMGYVRGQTLREWMAANPCRSRRNVDDTVALFQRAGAGLAHAHTEGMVHRDFKPDNALVGEDDAVRVVDFGLAAPAPGPSDPTGVGLTLDSRQQTLPGNESELSESRLTGDGEVVGTPAYMSPEQLLAQPADHRSDQYSFCVALYEALHGERPFGGKTMLALRNQVLIGDRPSTPNAVVPRWINDAVLRGLSREPAERFESMDALLQCLADDPAVRQRRRVTRVAAFVGVVGVAGFAYAQGRREEAIEPCPIVEDASVGGWDEPGRTAVRETLLQGDAPYREQTWATVETNLDEYARQWTAMQHDNCLATRVRVEQSEQLFDMRQGCLADRERSLRAVVEVLGSGNPDVVLRAATVSQGLPSLSVCAWSPAFVSPAPIPQDPELAEQVEQVRERLARAEATGRAGLYTAGLEQARAVATDAASIDFDPLRVEIEERIATAEYRLGQYDAAESRLDDVFWLALSAKHDRVLAAVAVHRVDVSVQRADGDQSDEWERRARAALARIGGDTMLEAALEGALGQRANDESRTADAIEHKRKAVELSRQAESPDPGFTADLLSSYASTMMRQGQIDESIPIYREAIDLLDGIVGPHHPSLASVHNNLGIALLTNGDPEAALEQLLTALEVYREVYPKGHIELANTLAVLGYIHNDRGHLDEAATFLLEALAMFREVMGPDHPKVGQTLHALGRVRMEQRRYDEVRTLVDEARALYTRRSEPDGAKTGDIENLLGEAELGQGNHAAALEAFGRSLQHRSRQLGEDSPWLAKDYRALARTHSAIGNLPLALENLDRAIAIRAKAFGPDNAKVGPLWQVRGDIQREHGQLDDAVTSYSRSIEILEAAGATNATVLARAHLGRALASAANEPNADGPNADDLAAARKYAAGLPDDVALHEALVDANPSG